MHCIEQEFTAGVLTITLADEANRNALSDTLKAELADAIDEACANPEVRVIVLTNKGRTFCAGANLKSSPSGRQRVLSAADVLSKIKNSPKPIVGKIAGHCIAGGVGLAAALDISIATEDAMFGFTEVRIGVSPAIISVFCLPKMSAADAREAFLRGNRFDAKEAQRMGLINRAVPATDLDEAVNDVVRDLIAGGPQAIANTKQVLNRVPYMEFDPALQWTTELSSRLFGSDEGREGIAAFREKRKAKWNTNDD